MNFTQEELKQKLDYNPETGVFTWKINAGRGLKRGDIAGGIANTGYHRIHVLGHRHLSHRLAWFYVYGKWPKYHIDHINGNILDNRIANLRDVAVRTNSQNRKEHRTGKLPGTSFEKSRNKWVAAAQINGKTRYLGRFSSEIEAHQAYINAVGKCNDY